MSKFAFMSFFLSILIYVGIDVSFSVTQKIGKLQLQKYKSFDINYKGLKMRSTLQNEYNFMIYYVITFFLKLIGNVGH